jgi:hypothetical protein
VKVDRARVDVLYQGWGAMNKSVKKKKIETELSRISDPVILYSQVSADAFQQSQCRR